MGIPYSSVADLPMPKAIAVPNPRYLKRLGRFPSATREMLRPKCAPALIAQSAFAATGLPVRGWQTRAASPAAQIPDATRNVASVTNRPALSCGKDSRPGNATGRWPIVPSTAAAERCVPSDSSTPV